VLHLAGAGACSWFEFAREIVSQAGLDCQVVPVSTSQMVRPARRPAYSVLGSRQAGAPPLPPWQQGLREYLAARVART
jgi:dTDP-4-dehydrorhamnose reductase